MLNRPSSDRGRSEPKRDADHRAVEQQRFRAPAQVGGLADAEAADRRLLEKGMVPTNR